VRRLPTVVLLGVVGHAALGAVAGCSGHSDPAAAPRSLIDESAPPGYPTGPLVDAAPAGSPLTEARAQLGKRLFFDPRLSRTGDIACASCHQQQHAFSDPRRVSIGVDGQTGTRNAPALVNLAWGESFFWDGRAKTLEDQAGMPIENPLEMDRKLADVVAGLNADPSYKAVFVQAFGQNVSEVTLRQALASFVRTLVSGTSRYDRYLRGEEGALSDPEKRGEAIFLANGGCFHCHPPGVLTNDGYFNDGSYLPGGDTGRQRVTGRPGDLGKFKVPTLRDIAASAPYMHDGSLQTLEEVVDRYDQGGLGDPSTDPQIVPLHLTVGEKADLVAFLNSLSDDAFLRDSRFRP
jgi:cytochrome c peroxidase